MSFFTTEEIRGGHEIDKSNIDLHKYLITEDSDLKKLLINKKNVLLIEPNYSRKYLPIGLSKIASFIKQQGGTATFSRNHIKGHNFDCVCITSVFTYDSDIVLKTIERSRSYYKNIPIIIGGIFATLMPEYIINSLSNTKNVFVFKGCSDFLDNTPADYSLDWKLKKPWDNFSYLFTTRGCPNNCGYCAVRKIEPEMKIIPNWKDQISLDKKYVMVRDNNFSAQPKSHIKQVTDYLSLIRKPVDMNGGVDCKLITPFFAKRMGKLMYYKTGLKIAFDRIAEDGIFQNAVALLNKYGVSKHNMMGYVLFNFNDSPAEADYRARTCEQLGLLPYPQRFVPLNYSTKLDTSFVGKKWSDALARAFRNYWLVPGIFKGISFKDYLIQIKKQKKFKITDADIDLFNQ